MRYLYNNVHAYDFRYIVFYCYRVCTTSLCYIVKMRFLMILLLLLLYTHRYCLRSLSLRPNSNARIPTPIIASPAYHCSLDRTP